VSAHTVVRPIRFSDDVDAMRAFLELLGLASRIESERGGWVDMVAGAGMVALHDTASSATGGRSGQTRLSFEVEHADPLAERLRAGGYDASVYDEAYGRVLVVGLPDGSSMHCDERQEDLYGYRLRDASPDPRTSVVATWQLDDARLLAGLGLERSGDGRFGDGGGQVWTGRADGLLVRTSEPLPEVYRRLTAAGHAVQFSDTCLTVTDPDGQPMQVQA